MRAQLKETSRGGEGGKEDLEGLMLKEVDGPFAMMYLGKLI